MSHIHLVANEDARHRLLQLGELAEAIHIIGSPGIDILLSNNLPPLSKVKQYYEIPFEYYAIIMFHPVTTEIANWESYTRNFVDAVLASDRNYIAIYPNNDLGSEIIMREFKRFSGNPRIRVFPSLRFEYFLVMLRHAQFVLGNSSAGVREASYYGVSVIDIGTRQQSRVSGEHVINVGYGTDEILEAIASVVDKHRSPHLWVKVDDELRLRHTVAKEGADY
ncbi:UDP-N-acetylglucosamine 2-epimerase [uncultured Neptuniibacter sp.]|uniref:UDP-N-acetylglucosamine 2-epimerase n=1 Tax=uncultured Neptuniibacter sp. TaxID=502143 RepID=UPI0026234847|nr:UDP-N-acetylglucosamine 2-epimerase [uncultured Neptuniibacter sp.]